MNSLLVKNTEFSELRKKGIGGSDASAILGLNTKKSAVEVWMEKMGRESEFRGNTQTFLGQLLEPWVIEQFQIRTGFKTEKRKALFSKKYPWMMANIDSYITSNDTILEAKTTFSEYSELVQGKVPDGYLIQCQHYLSVYGLEKAYIAAGIFIQNLEPRFEMYEVNRDEEIIKSLIDAETRFWIDCVEKRIPPDVDYSSRRANEVLSKLYEKGDDSFVNISDEFEEKIEFLNQIKDQIKIFETQKDEIEAILKGQMKEAQTGYCGKFILNWKEIKTNRFDSKSFEVANPKLFDEFKKESSYRRFSIKTDKKGE